MSETNLNTLKAKVREILRDGMLPTPDTGVDVEQTQLRYVAENGKEYLFLASRFVDKIAQEMQRLEIEAVRRYTVQVRPQPTIPTAPHVQPPRA